MHNQLKMISSLMLLLAIQTPLCKSVERQVSNMINSNPNILGDQPSAIGNVTVLKITPDKYRVAALNGQLIRDDECGHHFVNRTGLLYENKDWSESRQKRVLAWLRDNINTQIPR